jgi:hypothetical protein
VLNNGKENCISSYGVHFPEGDYPDNAAIIPFDEHSNNRSELYAIYMAFKITEE